jgi:hypothetical protein
VLDIALDRKAELRVDGREVRATNRVHHRSAHTFSLAVMSLFSDR